MPTSDLNPARVDGPAAEQVLQATCTRIRRQIDAATKASQLAALAAGDVPAAAQAITRLGARATGCARVSVWLFDRAGAELRCVDLYELAPGRHSSGAVLRDLDFRDEFRALRTARYVASNQPLHDRRTAGFGERYLKPLGITSMLDAGIRVSGRNVGVLCFEHVGTPHDWTRDEIAFACQLSDKIGLALVTSERVETERQLREREHRLTFANVLLATQLETSPDGILVVDQNGRVVSRNRRFVDMWRVPLPLVEAGDDAAMLASVLSQVKDPQKFLARVEQLYARPDETSHDEIELVDGRVFDRYSSFLRAESGEYLGRVWFFRDISRQRRAEAEIRYAARFDALTGLANRTEFTHAVNRAVERRARGGAGFAVLSIDLDRFKDVNDTLGHGAGDELLRRAAERLRAVCRASDQIARLGGDEFAVLASDLDDPAGAATLASTLIDRLSEPFAIDGNDVRTGCSVGIAVAWSDQPHADAILSQADIALYRAKADGRGRFRFFTDEMDEDVRTRVTLGNELREAIPGGQLFLEYQPQVRTSTRQITGVEALVRWRHPTRGVLPPAVFVSIAEQSGQVAALSQAVLRLACRQMRAWMDAGIAPSRVAVNLSALQFRVPAEVEQDVVTILQETGVPASCLELEVTESALMVASREQGEVLARLRAIGVRLALDDFGTGFSSLDYLRRYPVDRIKVPQNFVSQITPHNGTTAIVRAIIGLAHELGMATIAEGVETAAQLRRLTDWGCGEVQGFYFSAPLGPAAIEPWLRTGHRPREGRLSPTRDSRNGAAGVRSTLGNFTVELSESKPPRTVADFTGLAEGANEWTQPETG